MSNVLEMKKRNEEIAKKYSDLETKLLSAENPVHLFEAWMNGMAEAFGIPYLWVSIIAGPENAPLIRTLKTSPLLKDRVNVIDEDTFEGLVPKGDAPILVNEALRPFFRLLPQNKYFVKSMAVAPIVLKGRVIGSLNHGDSSAMRYEPNMDTSLLQSMTSRISSCLSAMAL